MSPVISPRGPLASRLGARLLGGFLLISLLPLLASNWIGYVTSQGITERLLGSSLEAVAQVQVTHIQDRTDGHVRYLQGLASGNALLSSGRSPAVAAYLARELAESGEFSDLFLLGLDGRLILSTGQTEGLEQDDLPRGQASPVALYGPVPTVPPALRFLVPLIGTEGDQVGSLGGVVRSSELHYFFQTPTHIGEEIETLILDEEWRPLFVSHPHGPVDYTQPVATALRDTDLPYASYRDREGVEVIGKISPVTGYPWFFLSEQPVKEALGPLRALRRTSLYLAGLLALLVVACAWIVSAEIVAPVRQLAGVAGRLGMGDLSARVSPQGSDEIDDLGRAFNDMAEELESASLRVQSLHEREIERAQQLATVGELASGLTHEIKNAVGAMSSGLDLLGRRVREEPSTAPIIEELGRAVAQIERVVKSFLLFARPPTPMRTLVDANRIADDAVGLVRPSAVQQGLQVHFDPDSDHPTLLADAEMIHQALVNLLVNAVQATPEGGQIRLSTGTHDGNVLFSVRDTGRGIPADQQHDIFRPFFTTRSTGTGLGLSLTRKIVDQHGGDIRVESEVGVGTTFTLAIPTGPATS